jgi:hypothetical protein
MDVYKRAVQVVKATFGLVSNNRALITNPEFFTSKDHIQCLLTDVHSVPEIPWPESPDAYVDVMDVPGLPAHIRTDGGGIWASGDFSALDAGVRDRRYSLFGNLGIFFKYTMATLERHHGIHSFHASAMYIPERHELVIVAGPPGAGKTVLLLSGLERGWLLFSAEMTHFSLGPQGCTFYKGALVDNIRIGNFLYDFPGVAEKKLGITLPKVRDPWGTKISVDLAPVSPKEDEIVNPTVTIIFPKIEAGRDKPIVQDISEPHKLILQLFNNATEKIGGTTLLYEAVPVDTVDTPDLMRRRLEDLQTFVRSAGRIRQAKSTLASARTCLDGIDL